jgi:hypothetical protein
VIDLVRRLFNLHDKEKGPASQAKDKEATSKEAESQR